MLGSEDERIARIFKQRIQAISPVVRVIVFGSRARGDAVDESDLDVFIELPEVTSVLHSQINEIAWEIGLENGLVVSPILTSTSLLVNGPLGGNPLIRAIQEEGVAV